MARGELTDRQQLDICILSSVHFEYGQACDTVDHYLRAGKLDRATAENIKSAIRYRFNNVVRVTSNHMDRYKINRDHRKDEPDIPTVVARATEG